MKKGPILSEDIASLPRIDKPWGFEIIWAQSESGFGYVGKLLHIKAGHRLSFQYHREKEETIFVKSGELYIETAGKVVEGNIVDTLRSEDRSITRMVPGDIAHIAPFMSHRFIAKEVDVELIEVSTKQLDDVVRIEDDYNRQ